jgi:hypothetical protein
VFYGILAWYFDNTLSHNRGVPMPKLFFLMPAYWIPSLRSNKVERDKVFNLISDQVATPSKTKFVTAIQEEKKIF